MGNHHKAMALGKQSLRLFRETGNRFSEGIELAGMGSIFVKLAQWDKAEKYLVEAYDILETRHPSKAGEVISMLARIRSMQGECMDDLLEEAYENAKKRITCHIEFLFQMCFYHYNLDQKEQLQLMVERLQELIQGSDFAGVGIYTEYPKIVQELLEDGFSEEE